MRTLKFIVDKQIIIQDPECDFSNIVPGTEGYLQAEFSFSPDWNNAIKVAGFFYGIKEFPPQVLKDGRTCIIPSEALKKNRFYLQVLGKKNKIKMVTNRIEVYQDGGIS